jgi:biopolymer transport protein ExbD
MAGGGGGGRSASSGRKGKFTSPVPIKKARIEIVPLIDVMFFLLASFMMVSLSLQQAKTRPMELVDARSSAGEFKPDILNIGVEKSGEISIGTNTVSVAELSQELAKRFKASAKAPIFVTGDKQASYASIAKVLDTVRRAGFQRISFVTQPRKSEE